MANRWDFPHKSPAAAIRRCAHVSRKQTNATDIVSVSAVVRMVRGTGEVRTVSRRRNAQSGRPSENDGGAHLERCAVCNVWWPIAAQGAEHIRLGS